MAAPSHKSVSATFDLAALQELIATLQDLGDVDKSNVLSEMVRVGAQPIVDSIKSFVPVDNGNLRASISAVVRKRKRKGTAFAVIGPRHGTYGRTDGANASQPSRYAHLVEFGFVHAKSGKRVSAKPFMRPGTTGGTPDATTLMLAGFQRGMMKVLAKHNKKLSKQLGYG